jgi:hypothetical protein
VFTSVLRLSLIARVSLKQLGTMLSCLLLFCKLDNCRSNFFLNLLFESIDRVDLYDFVTIREKWRVKKVD